MAYGATPKSELLGSEFAFSPMEDYETNVRVESKLGRTAINSPRLVFFNDLHASSSEPSLA
jgi:hypothetical protein